MASLYVTEFSGIANSLVGGVNAALPGSAQVPGTPALASQKISISGDSAQSAAFNLSTTVIRASADVICSIEVGGTDPTATAASLRLVADAEIWLGVKGGDKLAVISNT